MTLWIFYISVALVAYTYVGFPLLVYLRAIMFRREFETSDHTPSVTLIVASYNEEASIRDKLENILLLDYPRDELQVLVASDGSTDQTNAIVAEYESLGVQLLTLPRQGKAGALNDAVGQAEGDILVFTDSNSQFETDAIRKLVGPFADPSIGGVAGNQCYLKGDDSKTSTGKGERNYWGFDRWLKKCESDAGNTISATGAIYAIRRSLFDGVPVGVTDDFAVSTSIIVQGYRLVFVPSAIAWEPVGGSSRVEFGRKVRVITRGLSGVWLRRTLLNPFKYGFYSVQLFSHKVLRRLMFVPLLTALVMSVLLAEHTMFLMAAMVQGAVYALAIAGWIVDRMGWPLPKVLSLPFFFGLVNLASMIAAFRLLSGQKIVQWQPQRETADAT